MEEFLELMVAEAETKDMGRVMARIDPDDMNLCRISPGDIIEIRGKRLILAKVMPTYPAKRGKKIIQLDGISRGNAKVGLDDKVSVKKVECKDAELVVFSPTQSLNKPIPIEIVRKNIETIPLLREDLVRVTLFGTQTLEFIAKKVEPESTPVIIRYQTEIRIDGQPKGERSRGTCYEDIGGLHNL